MTHEMPVTMRYSASLDRPYEDGSEMNRDRKSSTSTEQPHSPGSESYSAELWNDVQRNKNNLELGFSDSMDSLGLDDDSQSSASGHSRHHSSDGGNSSSPAYSTRPLASLTPKPPPFNPLQFVKTITSPLVKKAEEQIKQYEEVKKVKELVKEEAEEWQSNLDGWKSRRRLVSQKSVQRVEEGKQIEEEVERTKRKSKTFSEMMEERSKRGVTKPLPTVYSDDSFPIEVPPLAVEEDFDNFTHNEDSKFEEKTVEDSQNVQTLTSNNGHNKDDTSKLSNIIEVNDNKEKIIIDTAVIENDEVKINDDVLSLQINNAQDTKVIDEDIKEVNRKEPGQVVELSIQFRRHVERKDFGFSLKNVKGIGTEVFIEAIQEQSPAALAGLNVNDEVIAINGEECFQERSFSAIVFAIKQALHTGQLQLIVYRYQNPVSVLQNQTPPKVKDDICHSKEPEVEILPKVDVKKRRSLFEQPATPERVVLNRRSLDLSNNIVGKVASFENSAAKYKSSEVLNVDEEINKNGFKRIIEDLNAQVGSGLKYGFELASTLQETPIVNSSPPHSPLDDRQMDTILNFDLIKDEDVVIVNYDPLTAPEHSVKSPEPPKEKPPPPPPLPTGDVKLRRVESTKRILNEIHKRRSNFLGIEDDEFQLQIEQQMSQVSPPPNVDEMSLKMERERLALNTSSSGSDIYFEKEIDATLFSPTNSPLTYQDDIDQREQEAIENLEWEEGQKLNVCGNGLSAAAILTTEVPKPSTAVKVVLGKSVGNEHSPENKGKSLEEKELELKMQEERLRGEKEKLRKEQEELLRRKKEYEEEIQRSQGQQFQMQQKKTVVVESQDMGGQKLMTPSLVTLNLLQTTSSIVPGIKQLPPPILTKPKPNENTSFSSIENMPLASLPQFQILSKPNLVALSAPPKAKLMDGEEWLQKKKRENYHQHWLVQEAEFRRLQAAQAKDSVKSRLGDDRLLSESSLPARHVNEMTSQHHTNGSTVQEHPQKLAPRPPAKPSFPISPSSNNNRSSNSQLSPNANSSLHNQSSSNISDSGDFQMLSVSGKKRCSHCGIELGRGAAMIIESLHLYYHIGCFKCCVCHIQLGNGSSGTDVRVRSQKLHCHNCYSNDKGLKFSKV